MEESVFNDAVITALPYLFAVISPAVFIDTILLSLLVQVRSSFITLPLSLLATSIRVSFVGMIREVLLRLMLLTVLSSSGGSVLEPGLAADSKAFTAASSAAPAASTSSCVAASSSKTACAYSAASFNFCISDAGTH